MGECGTAYVCPGAARVGEAWAHVQPTSSPPGCGRSLVHTDPVFHAGELHPPWPSVGHTARKLASAFHCLPSFPGKVRRSRVTSPEQLLEGLETSGLLEGL